MTEKESPKHSPLPWVYDPPGQIKSGNGSGPFVCEMNLVGNPADCDIILRAANSYPDMKRLTEIIANHPDLLSAADKLYRLSIWREMEELARTFQEMNQ